MVHFYVLCSKNILMKLVVYQQPICLCVKMEFVVGTISLSCELFPLLTPGPALSRSDGAALGPTPLGAPGQVVRQVVDFLPDNACAKEL